MDYKKTILVVLSIIVLAALGLFGISYQGGDDNAPPLAKVEILRQTPEPKKTDFGTTIPSGFPTNIPLEKGLKTEQSYLLDYTGQKQLTIVFLSTKTVAENYALYTNFLKKENWKVGNKYEGEKLSFLYGTYGEGEVHDINVTISEHTQASSSAESKVSISVLKK